jgi:UDP-N-acetylglucosamine--N-acetylmuramyl-(pentapeptide) pyrophosphoryl-undecaprenol N-acetylglucosamine transferase
MRVAIAGGGTGGHLFPGIAIAQELTRRGNEVFFIGNPGRIEAEQVPKYGFEIELIRGGQVLGVGLVGAVKGLLSTLAGLFQALRVISRRKPAAVVGVGGYASVAGVLAAWIKGKPAFVCEQNSVPGRANRMLSRFAQSVFTAFPEAAEKLPVEKIEQLGNPLRAEFRECFENARKAKDGRPCLFVFGGSQGARSLNKATMAAVRIWSEQGDMPRIIHQTGRLDHKDVLAEYGPLGANVEIQAFIEDMPETYAQADLLLARAGATTISEVAACGLPSILVPLPSAADDHQRKNANALTGIDAAIAIENDELTGEKLVETVEALLSDTERLTRMARAARSWDRPNAASAICDRIETPAKER